MVHHVTAARPAWATAHSDEFGLGIMLGDPSGISGRLNLGSKAALDFGLAFSVNSDVTFLVDYLFQFPHAFHSTSQFISQITPYLGIGGVLALGTQTTLYRAGFRYSAGSATFGVRIPVGLEWRPSTPSLGIFLELAPGLFILPSTQGLIQGDIGIRFYF